MQSPLRNWSRSEKLALWMWVLVIGMLGTLGFQRITMPAPLEHTQEIKMGRSTYLSKGMYHLTSPDAGIAQPAPFPPRRQTPISLAATGPIG